MAKYMFVVTESQDTEVGSFSYCRSLIPCEDQSQVGIALGTSNSLDLNDDMDWDIFEQVENRFVKREVQFADDGRTILRIV